MSSQTAPQPPPALRWDDILYVLFRRKWLILAICALGLVAALSLPFVIPQIYESQAKLYVRYVPEPQMPISLGPESARPILPEQRLDGLMNTEVEIINNLSLAQEVAGAIGVNHILGPGAASGDTNQAALALLKGLYIEVPKSTTVLQLRFKHSKPEIVQPVLNQFIEAYYAKHKETHELVQAGDTLSREVDGFRVRVQQTKEELNKAKERVGVTSLEEAKRACAGRYSTIRQQLYDAEAELAAQRARVAALTNEATSPVLAVTNGSSTSNDPVQVPRETVAEYRAVCRILETLAAKEQELLGVFQPSNVLVQEVRARIAENEKQKKLLEAEHPALLARRSDETRLVTVAPGPGPQPDLAGERGRLGAAEARVEKLTEHLAQVRQEITALNQAEGSITELETRLALEESQYKRFGDRLEQLRTGVRMGDGRVLNIFRLQPPSPPIRTVSKIRTMMAGVFFGGIGVALGLAFLLELFLDCTIKRAQDVVKLRLPLFLSVPMLGRQPSASVLDGKTLVLPAPTGDGSRQPAEVKRDGALVHEQGETAQEFITYSEALRDRIMTWFEDRQMTHKPKLVALTSCGKGAGVSTFAAGLARSMSETGEGNVLLVDMNVRNGAAHHFHRGDLACGLDEVLESDKRESALVLEKLYVVSEAPNSEKLPGVLPQRFKSLVPKLKASDYDYIIFDLPPVSQVSVTPRLSRFMDLVLVVVEAERTNREVVKQAGSLISETHENVGVVLNKGRNYVPHALKQEI